MFTHRTLRVVEMVALSAAIACLLSVGPVPSTDEDLSSRSGYIVASS